MSRRISKERLGEFEEQSKLLLATIEFDIKFGNHFVNEDFDSKEHLKHLYVLAKDAVQNQQVTKVKNWLRDFTEEREDDIALQNYVYQKTGIELNLRVKLLRRIQKIIDRGVINTDSQFYDVLNEVNFITQKEEHDTTRLKLLNDLIIDFEERNKRKN